MLKSCQALVCYSGLMTSQREIILIAHNLRSAHNVGSLLRTAEGLGVEGVYLTGYTPYPEATGDTRLPHIRDKVSKQIHKTALGAEVTQKWQYADDIGPVIQHMKQRKFTVVGLEQDKKSLSLPKYRAPSKIVLVVGREVEGLEPEVRAMCDLLVEIPMFGQKESFNVVQASAMALYQLAF